MQETVPLLGSKNQNTSDRKVKEAIALLENLGFKITPPPPPKRDISTANDSFRARMWDYVEGDFDSAFEYFILFLIFANVIMFMVGTVKVGGSDGKTHIPCLGPDLGGSDTCTALIDKYSTSFYVFELFSSIVFTIEYALRVWSCVEDPRYAGPHGRIKYMTTFYAVTDLISFLPTWIELLPGIGDITSTGFVRVFRLIRLLKAEKYVDAFAVLGGVLRENSILLIAAAWYAFLMLVVFATILYYTERNWSGETRKYYNSIPQGLFPTILMLTGEYPLSDFSPAGQFFASILALTAVAIFGIPTAVLGSGFVRALQENQGKEFTVDA